MTSHALANELAKLAEHLKQQPDLDIGTMHLFNGYGPSAEQFKALAKVFPRPLKKEIRTLAGQQEIVLRNETIHGLNISFSVAQSKVCRMVVPARAAVYDCEPLLSPEEEAELEAL
jgi:hypothetical protein